MVPLYSLRVWKVLKRLIIFTGRIFTHSDLIHKIYCSQWCNFSECQSKVRSSDKVHGNRCAGSSIVTESRTSANHSFKWPTASHKSQSAMLWCLALDSAVKGTVCPHVLIYSFIFCKHKGCHPSVQSDQSHNMSSYGQAEKFYKPIPVTLKCCKCS